MTVRSLGVFLCAAALLSASPTRTQGQELQKPNAPRLKAYVTVKPAKGLDMEKIKSELAATGATASSMLPLFTYNVEASRDQNDYTGVMVGANPFTAGGNKDVSVLTHVIPIIIITETVGVGLSNTGIISTRPGTTTFDPTAADNFCLNAPNNVPEKAVPTVAAIQPGHVRLRWDHRWHNGIQRCFPAGELLGSVG